MTRSGFYLIIKVGRENTNSRNGVPTRPGVPTLALPCMLFCLFFIHLPFEPPTLLSSSRPPSAASCPSLLRSRLVRLGAMLLFSRTIAVQLDA